MLNRFKDFKRCIHISYHIFDFVQKKNAKFILEHPTCRLSYIDNTMPADALATLAARASAVMVLITKAGIFRFQHQKS